MEAMMAGKAYALGLDFGTNSVRALIADVSDGAEIATAVAGYPSGQEGILLDPKNDHLARQDPGDWLTAMEAAVKKAIRIAKAKPGFSPQQVIGIGVDTTGSTPLPLDRDGLPLAMHKEFGRNLNAMAWLWKDHTSHAEAAEITALACKMGTPYLAKCGGTYSSEWFFSKILHCLRTDPKVAKAAASWAECSDYIPAVLTGTSRPDQMKRNVCAAGHKAMFNPQWGGLPAPNFLARLDPRLAQLRPRLYDRAYTANQPAGGLTPEWARRFGLPPGTVVAVGAMDAHLGGIGSGIKPGTLVKIIGTSTCDMMVAEKSKRLADVPGLCGIVDGSIIPGLWGLEAGQSAVGDIFNWFVSALAPEGKGHAELTREAIKLAPGQSGLLALDWNNGNRTVLVDPRLTGLLVGQTLHTTPAEIYRALIEATAFGARVIIDRFEEYGIKVREIVNCGGISEKNQLLLQIYADVIGRPMKIARSGQAPALGACIIASVAAGKPAGHPSVPAAQKAMAGLKPTVFRPQPKNVKTYNQLFALYHQLHDAFGGLDHRADLGGVMKKLLTIKETMRS
jgi:L-ribulokinase